MLRELSAAAMCLCSCAAASGVIINFDDRPGMMTFLGEGTPVPPEFLIDDEYLAQGVRFNSGGGGLALAASSNPVSMPNTVNATRPGPVVSYLADCEATFWVGLEPGRVDSVSITLTSTSSSSSLLAFDPNGTLLGQSSGAASATLSVTFPGQIHRVVIQQGPMAFDNFTFEGLVPAPSSLGAFAVGVWAMSRRRRPCELLTT